MDTPTNAIGEGSPPSGESGKVVQGQNAGAAGWLVGGGEMGERICVFDWSKTPIGPVESWSPALRTMVRILLANRFPHILWWGPQYIQFYNDPYRPIPGTKHPEKALGQPASECWSEIWHVIGPLIDTPFNGGPATWDEDICLEVNRYGFVEETHFTIAYSPVPDETAPRGIGGVLATVHEITEKVVGERRVIALRDLGARVGEAKTAEEACRIAAEILAAHDKDLPFALLYLIDDDGTRAHLAGAAGVEMGKAISPRVVEFSAAREGGWPLAEARQSEAMQVVEHLGERFATVPPGPWSDPPDTAVVVPIPSNKTHAPAGLLVAGVSARLKLDQFYRDFIELVRTQVATAIANARAYEEERKRAEALAELDRAKTLFFTNISHEFRTPLTLMLGPVEDVLAKPEDEVLPENRALLTVAHHNGLRLLKLVNTLLDFSRIEAGRMQAVYERTDIAALTSDLASQFRAAVERAGMRLSVNCPAIDAPVYLDRDMWEKIVLNLLSNAFKFTFEGEIDVRLCRVGEVVELTVRDTGVGIPAKEVPYVFERFHRVEGTRRRSHEGTGIGLALVSELVKLHGGAVWVESVEGQGTTFTVSIPTGSAHLPQDRIGATRTLSATSLGPDLFVEEALRWLPDDGPPEPAFLPLLSGADTLAAAPQQADDGARPRIMLADDNADMREYVRRLLCQRFEVAAVANGRAALDAVRQRRPDLVLTDIMMPELDGLGLLQQIRADPHLRELPVILLSARAGEEASVEGLQAGADDYLIKPFSARELVARVGVHLQTARLRREATKVAQESERRFREMIDALPATIYTTDAEGRLTHFNPAAVEFSGRVPELGSDTWCVTWKLYYPDGRPMPHDECPMAIALREGRAVRGAETIAERPDGTRIWFEPYPTPLRDSEGRTLGGINMLVDITARKQAEEIKARLAAIIESSDDAIVSKSLDGTIRTWNAGAARIFGYSEEEAVGKPITMLIPPERQAEEQEILQRLRRGERVEHIETVRLAKDGRRIDMSITISPIHDGSGAVIGASKVGRDITERKRAVEEIVRQREDLHALIMQSPVPICVLRGPELVYEMANAAYMHVIGGRDILGKPLLDALPEFRGQGYDGVLREVMRTGDPAVGQESQLMLERGGRLQETYWTFIFAPLRDPDGRINRVVALCNEVTEQKRQAERLQLLWEAAAVLLTANDPDAMLRELFARIGPQCGLDAYFNYLVNDGGDGLRLVSCVGIPVETAHALERLEFGQAICGTVALHRQPIVATHIQQSDDPKAQLVKSFGIRAYVCNPLMSEGQLLGTLSFASRTRDEFDAAELAFLATICHYVTVAYERLRLLDQLRAADRRKDEFLATLAHELRNPLAPIRNAVQLLRIKGPAEPDLQWGQDVIDQQVDHLTRLIEDLLDVSRITRNRLDLRRQRVDLAEVVQGAVESSRPTIEPYGHDLTVTLPPEPVYLYADVVRLAQVFTNLLTNAVKYTEPGGRIWLTAERQGRDAVVSVKDTGVGIPAEALPRLFELFFQGDRSLERSQGGLGIGLTLTKRLVEMHGGTIMARSDGPGRGSEFIVRLPVVVEPPPVLHQVSAEPSRATPAVPRRILVVDDNRISATSFAMLLQHMGHDLRTAHDGVEATAVAEEFRPDVILLDIGLPRLNGYDAARKIRQQSWGQGMVLIAVTGWGQEADRQRSKEAGFDHHLVKPVDRAALTQLLASL